MDGQWRCSEVRTLGQGVLTLYEQALRLRLFGAAEHLLGAIEELARVESKCGALRDQAYLMIDPHAVRA